METTPEGVVIGGRDHDDRLRMIDDIDLHRNFVGSPHGIYANSVPSSTGDRASIFCPLVLADSNLATHLTGQDEQAAVRRACLLRPRF